MAPLPPQPTDLLFLCLPHFCYSSIINPFFLSLSSTIDAQPPYSPSFFSSGHFASTSLLLLFLLHFSSTSTYTHKSQPNKNFVHKSIKGYNERDKDYRDLIKKKDRFEMGEKKGRDKFFRIFFLKILFVGFVVVIDGMWWFFLGISAVMDDEVGLDDRVELDNADRLDTVAMVVEIGNGWRKLD